MDLPLSFPPMHVEEKLKNKQDAVTTIFNGGSSVQGNVQYRFFTW